MLFNRRRARLRRAAATRKRLLRAKKMRLTVHRSNRHIYAQIISECGSKTLAEASSLSLDVGDLKGKSNIALAKLIGKAIAERSVALGISEVAFDRSGFIYHGKVKCLADAAREHGLKF